MTRTDRISNPKLDINKQLREAREEALRPRDPIEVDVIFNDKLATVRMPYLFPDDLDALTGKHSPHPAYRDALGCWFLLGPVIADHPDIVLVQGGEESDLWELRGKEAVYLWPEVYAAAQGRRQAQSAGRFLGRVRLRATAADEGTQGKRGQEMNAYEERGPRIEGFADRLIEVYVHRAGSEDTSIILDELEDSSEDLVRDLGELVVTLAFRAANAMTVYDITDPERRLLPEKIDRLREQLEDATRRWAQQVKEAENG